MTDRIVKVILRGDVSHLKAAATDATRSITGAADKMTAATKEGQKFQHGMTAIGDTAGTIGLSAAAGFGLVSKAAMDWESAWAGVEKTVDGSASEMAGLEEELRELAKTLPATHQEIAAVAEAAGQLGVARDDIADFTRTMIDLGETTNLTADAAATAIAQMMNVMQSSPDDVDELASTLVALGNAGASTEADILSMAQRLSGVGNLIGASEADVLALASSMADLGIESELGGGAMSRTITKIYSAVKSGGAQLEQFADLAGMSAEQFATAFQEDPIRALDSFLQGLNGIDEAGGNVVTTLGDLGIKGTQDLQVLLRMKGAQDGLTNSLNLSSTAWEQNTALAVEAAKRYETTAAQTQVAWNNVKDTAIDFGDAALPVLSEAADLASKFASAIGELPGPVKSAGTSLLAITAVLGGGLWFGAKTINAVTGMRTALTDVGISGDKASRGMSALAKAGVVLAAASIADELMEIADATSTMQLSGLTRDLATFGETGRATGEIAKNFGDDLQGLDALITGSSAGLGEALAYAAQSQSSWVDQVENFLTGGNQYVDRIGEMDTALATLAQSNMPAAEDAFAQLSAAAEEQGVSLDQLRGLFPEYAAELERAAAEAEGAADSTDGYATATASAGDAAAQTAEQIQGAVDAMREQRAEALRAEDAQLAYESALLDARDAVREHGKVLSRSGDLLEGQKRKGIEAKSVLLDLAGAWNNLSDVEKNSAGARRRAIASFVDTAVQLGMSRRAAREYAQALFEIPPKRVTKITAETSEAAARVAALRANLAEIQSKTVTVTVNQRGGVTSSAGGRSAPVINADGNLLDYYADGGVRPRIGDQMPHIRPFTSARGVTWSELGSGPWEAFVSGHPAKKQRSRAIAGETVARLGGEVTWKAADGALFQQFAPQYSQMVTQMSAPVASGRSGGPVRLAGPVDIRGTVNIPGVGVGNLEGTMRAIAREEVDNVGSYDASRGRQRAAS